MKDFILEKKATNSHLKGNINISKVPINLLPKVSEKVIIVLGDDISHSNFVFAKGYRINNVLIGNWLQQNNIGVGSTFYIRIINNNTFEFLTNA